MCIGKEEGEKVGGVEENRNVYGGDDKDFCIRIGKAGVKIIRLPRDSVKHLYPEKKRPAMKELEVLFYLLRRHPRQMLIPALKLIYRKILRVIVK